jgi:hypothetical protein
MNIDVSIPDNNVSEVAAAARHRMRNREGTQDLSDADAIREFLYDTLAMQVEVQATVDARQSRNRDSVKDDLKGTQ